MKPARQCLWGVAGLLLLLAASTPRRAGAMDSVPMPLPNFQLTKPDGTIINSNQVPLQNNWLLVFTMADCPPCDNFLRLMNKKELPDVAPQVVVVVSGATADKVKDMMARFPDLAEAAWYADPSRNAARQVKLSGMPAVFGARGSSLQWCILGVLSGDAARMKNVLTSWVQAGQNINVHAQRARRGAAPN